VDYRVGPSIEDLFVVADALIRYVAPPIGNETRRISASRT